MERGDEGMGDLCISILLFGMMVALCSFFFDRSDVSVVHSGSSSLLGKVLVLPFPLTMRSDYAFRPGGPRE